jgi:Flp pilus assembly protein TadB
MGLPEDLQAVQDLHEKGNLTDQEFTDAKAAILKKYQWCSSTENKSSKPAASERGGAILAVYWLGAILLIASVIYAIVVWPWWVSTLIILGVFLVICIRRRKPPRKSQAPPLHVRLGAALAVILLMGLILVVVNWLGAEPSKVEIPVIIFGLVLYGMMTEWLGARRFSGGREVKAAEGKEKAQTGEAPHGVHTPH